MNQCLRCNKPCNAISMFCDQCRSDLHLQGQWSVAVDVSGVVVPGFVSPSSWQEGVEELKGEDFLLERAVTPRGEDTVPEVTARLYTDNGRDDFHADMPPIDASFDALLAEEPVAGTYQMPLTPPEGSQPLSSSRNAYATQPGIAEQSLLKLNNAARLIASVEQASVQGHRSPRASRLARLHDISDDIRRDSTPLPQTFFSTHPGSPAMEKSLPDWLRDPDPDPDIDEHDDWQSQHDPLQSRRFPSNSEITRIEEEDMRLAISTGLADVTPFARRGPTKRLRFVFASLITFAIIALVVDTALLSMAFMHNHHKTTPTSDLPPSLTLSQNIVTYGQTITLHIRNFPPSTQVFLTRDIAQQVYLNGASNPVLVDVNGAADVNMAIESSWDPGSHTIEAEDIADRHTANATLRINAGPTRPAHLLLVTTQLDFGSDIQGANTIQQLELRNGGSGTIAWSASSDQSWLLISPSQGTFSDAQTISVAVQRTNLTPKDYSGTLTFASNVGPTQTVQASMTVLPLPHNVGAVLSVTPALATFTAVDGNGNPQDQFLQVSNPGKQPLYWMIGDNTPMSLGGDAPFSSAISHALNWLNPQQTSGKILPGGTSLIRLKVNSSALLPGTYNTTLVFDVSPHHTALNSPETVSVSLIVEPRCGISLNTGSMSFTAVSGQAGPANQAVTLEAMGYCTGTISWSATSSASWLSATPTQGQLKGNTGAVAVSVNTLQLAPGTYNGEVIITLPQSTQSLAVQLTVQSPPPPTAPILGAAPLNLNFSTTEGADDPPGQVVTITNTGGTPLLWHTAVQLLATSWLGVSPTGGTIQPGQTGQLTINVSANDSGLSPGEYAGQVTVEGSDENGNLAAGSPQTILINFMVSPPCTLSQPTASTLAFSATQGQSNPTTQTESITASGDCSWPVSWSASLTSSASWLSISPSSGTLGANGGASTVSVTPNIAGLAPGIYQTRVFVSATDASGTAAQGSPQVFTVTLTVFQACTLQIVGGNGLTFSVTQGQTSNVQNLAFSTTGNCALPVSWSVGTDAGSSGWLALSAVSGSGGSGSVGVSVNAANLTPGQYTSAVTVSAMGSGGATVQASPQSVPVTLTVNGSTVSGTATICSETSCASPGTPAVATVSLINSNGTVVATTAVDASGNFSFKNIPNGTYTISGNGTDNSNTAYSGSVPVNINGSSVNVTLPMVSGSN